MGCSLPDSSRAASKTSSFSEYDESVFTSVTTGMPLVIVPVLSSTAISALPASSRAVAVLKSMPAFAPLPLPTMIATGVASPSAQGQLITKTLMACLSEISIFLVTLIHTTKTSNATKMTVGTNIPDTLSAVFAIGAFDDDASSTSFTMPARVVFSPTFLALTVTNPLTFVVPDMTDDPTVLSMGMLSPVTEDSLTEVSPETISPSAAKFSPGRTTNKSFS